MTRKLRALLLSSALVIAAPSALAQGSDASEDTAEVLDTVIVQAARRDVPIEALPQTVQLIDTETIRAQSLLSTNLVDVIGQVVPSFSPSRQKLSGRGETFRGREPLYLIDGVPQSNPLRNGDRDGFTVDPAVIERIEVLFGANAIQGPGANSGIINYVTVSPEDGEDWSVRTEIGATLSSDFDGDGTGYRGAVTASRDFGQFDLVANFAGETRGAFYDGEGRRIGVDATQGDIQDSVTTNFFLKAGFDIDSNTRIQGSVNLFELEGDGDYVQIAGDRALDIPAISVRGDVEGQPPTNTVETYNLT
ncbi:MAG: TonB-dependent receptor plug domain-containing protein, partial [Pseudomonadota bacterium]